MLFRLLPLLALPLLAQNDWDDPFPPHRIADNFYYVGSKGLSTYLVTSTKGHILINASFERTVPIIRANVEKLGFKLSDVKILLSSHAHDDHAGGLALLKELTGAEVYVMAGDDKVISSGGKGQYLYKADWKPCKVDRVLKDGDVVELGDAKLRAHLTPGHTRGNTTWTLQVNDQGKSLNAVIIGSPNVNPGFQLVNNKEYPEMAADYARTFRVLKSLECDLFLGAHGLYYGMGEKHKRLKPGGPNPFIDPTGYREYVADREQFYLYTLEQQQKLVAQTDLPTAEWVLQFGGRVRLPNSANWINDPSQLPKTGFRLEAVDLVGTIIDHKDLSKLSACTELRELLLPGTIFNPGAGSTLDANDELKALATLTKLDKLGFSLHFLTNVNVSDKGLKQFANLKQLRELRFSMTRIKGEGLAPFVNTEKLDLSYTPVTDAGLASVAGMSKLRQLGLRDTFVTDDGLTHLAQLKALESLDLYGLKLTDRGAGHLRGLTNLHTLNLLGAQLSDDSMEVLARMTQLTELNLYRSQITNAGLAKLKTLKNLSTLDLRYTRVTRNGIEDFRAAVPGVQIAFQESTPASTDSTLRTSAPTAKSPAAMAAWIERLGGRSGTEAGQIRSIDLSRTPVTEAQLGHLAALPALERLRLNTTEVGDGGMANLAKLTALRDLDLGHTMVSDNGLAPLAALKQLQRLTLNHTLVKGAGLHNVPTIEDLDVANAPINDAGAMQIAILANLQNLRLAYTDISNAGVQALAPLKKLRRLDLLSTDISDDTMKALAGFTNLESLNISYNKIGAKGLAHLATLTSLTQLEAARTRIDDEAVPHLARFTALKQLNLDYTALSDKGLALLQPALPNLELLRLDTANLTDAAIDTLAKFPKLRELNIYHTLITEAANNRLQQLKPETRIVFDPASALPTRRKS